AVVNGTAALHTALLVAGVKPEEEVLVSNLTFVAPVNAILYCRAYPVLMDADPKTWQMDTTKVEQFLEEECELREDGCFNKKTGRRISAIVPVHILGLGCAMDKIVALARRFLLKVVEDAAEGMGVRYQGRHVGTFGDIAAFSFNGNKDMTTGGGGMVVTANKQYADHARYLTTQAKDDPSEYIHNAIGYNYRLPNVLAAIGLAQLEKLESFLMKKRESAKFYQEALQDEQEITPMPMPKDCEPTFWLYTILVTGKDSGKRRKAIIQYLHKNGVEARSLWHPIHNMPPYVRFQAYQIEHSMPLYENAICLPSSVGLTTEDLQKVVAVLRQGLKSIRA
ncbi:MAG: hypothetical protein A2W61_06260, partial [Deltaproteobacteria bacterium RIFCSPLOWO2_01_44_7]